MGHNNDIIDRNRNNRINPFNKILCMAIELPFVFASAQEATV